MSVKVYWSKNAIASSGNQSSYGDAREADESGSETLNTDGSSVKMMGAFRSSIRGGATFRLERSYWAFNMSSYQGTTLAGLKFNFKPTTSTSPSDLTSNRLIKTDAFGNSSNFSNYSPEDWFESLNYGTTYSSAFTFPDSSTAQEVTLNSNATSQISANGFLQICMVTALDYNGLGMITDVNQNAIGNIGNNTTGNVYLSFDEPGYGNNVNGVTASNIVKVNDVAAGSITKLNDVA
tara:strand:+ start:1626 stop:2333 length:708 start_codon:yes stop_codon:yes gene_type:complete